MADPSVFDLDTAARPPAEGAGPGRWTAELSDRWDIRDKPNGGYVLATAVRAMGGAVPTHPHPFTVTAHYLRPSEPGPAEIDVEAVRTGRKLATVAAAFSQRGKERIRVLGTFGDLAEANGPTAVRAQLPKLAPLEECVDRHVPVDDPDNPMSRIAENCEVRLDPSAGWITGRPTGVAEHTGWVRFADGSPADVWSLPFFADALPPALFEVLEGTGWVPTIELTVHVRAVPVPGWLRASMSTRVLMNGYFEEDGELWDSAGTLVAQSRQLGMIFRP